MIEEFILSNLCPTFDVVFIDEAQDLSPIQWKMYNLIKANSKIVILAGDDDQAIYGWAGADVKRFQDEPAKEKVLPKSYRVPIKVQQVAYTIISQIETRFPRNGNLETTKDIVKKSTVWKKLIWLKVNG